VKIIPLYICKAAAEYTIAKARVKGTKISAPFLFSFLGKIFDFWYNNVCKGGD
jgi:hypothetical protein